MGRVLWKRLKSARMGKEQKGSTRDLTTAVGRVGSCQPYISSCALCRTIYPHILLNRGPGVSLSMGPTVIHLHDAVPCQNYSAFIQAAHLGVKVRVDPEQELFMTRDRREDNFRFALSFKNIDLSSFCSLLYALWKKDSFLRISN